MDRLLAELLGTPAYSERRYDLMEPTVLSPQLLRVKTSE